MEVFIPMKMLFQEALKIGCLENKSYFNRLGEAVIEASGDPDTTSSEDVFTFIDKNTKVNIDQTNENGTVGKKEVTFDTLFPKNAEKIKKILIQARNNLRPKEEKGMPPLKKFKKMKEFIVNGTIGEQFEDYYFSDPKKRIAAILQDPRKWRPYHGPRGSGKSTTIMWACVTGALLGGVFISLEGFLYSGITPKEFWEVFNYALELRIEAYLQRKVSIGKTEGEFTNFATSPNNGFEMVLCIDEFDMAKDYPDICKDLLVALRAPKQAIRPCVVGCIILGPSSILDLAIKDVKDSDTINVSPFNVQEQFPQQNFDIDDLKDLACQLEKNRRIQVEQEIIEDILEKTSGYASFVIHSFGIIEMFASNNKVKKVGMSEWISWSVSKFAYQKLTSYKTVTRLVQGLQKPVLRSGTMRLICSEDPIPCENFKDNSSFLLLAWGYATEVRTASTAGVSLKIACPMMKTICISVLANPSTTPPSKLCVDDNLSFSAKKFVELVLSCITAKRIDEGKRGIKSPEEKWWQGYIGAVLRRFLPPDWLVEENFTGNTPLRRPNVKNGPFISCDFALIAPSFEITLLEVVVDSRQFLNNMNAEKADLQALRAKSKKSKKDQSEIEKLSKSIYKEETEDSVEGHWNRVNDLYLKMDTRIKKAFVLDIAAEGQAYFNTPTPTRSNDEVELIRIMYNSDFSVRTGSLSNGIKIPQQPEQPDELKW